MLACVPVPISASSDPPGSPTLTTPPVIPPRSLLQSPCSQTALASTLHCCLPQIVRSGPLAPLHTNLPPDSTVFRLSLSLPSVHELSLQILLFPGSPMFLPHKLASWVRQFPEPLALSLGSPISLDSAVFRLPHLPCTQIPLPGSAVSRLPLPCTRFSPSLC